MRPPRFLPAGHGGGAHARPRFHPAGSLFDARWCRAGRACPGSPRRTQRLPAVSLAGSYELLAWLIRTSGAAEHLPSAEHPCNRAACRSAMRCLPVSTAGGDRCGGSERHPSDPARRPAGQATRPPAIPARAQRDDEVPEASTVNDAAVAAYALSVQAGNPLSERRLAQMFGRTSRRWARARIADARQASSIQAPPGTPAMA
jgi:hypothetical protein